MGRGGRFSNYESTDNTEIRYYMETLPEIYKMHDRECLRCSKTFRVRHKFIRVCPTCKEKYEKHKYDNAIA